MTDSKPFRALMTFMRLGRGRAPEPRHERPTHADWPLILDAEARVANGHASGRAGVELRRALSLCGLDDGRELREWYRQHDVGAFIRLMPSWPSDKP